jgi:hypothetical protein
LQRLLATMCIDADDRFGAWFVLETAKQCRRSLTAKWGVTGQHNDHVSRLCERPPNSSDQSSSGPAARWIL